MSIEFKVVPHQQDFFIRMVPKVQMLRLIHDGAAIILVDGVRKVSFIGILKNREEIAIRQWILSGDDAVAEGIAEWVED